MTKSLRERLMAEAVDAPYDGDVAAVLTPGEAIHIFAEWLESDGPLLMVEPMLKAEAEFSPGKRILYGYQPKQLAEAGCTALSRTIRGE